MTTTEDDLLPPTADAKKPLIGIREVVAENAATMRTVMRVRGHQLVTDEPRGDDTGPTPLEMVLSALLGCEAVIIHRCAQAMRFDYTKLDMSAAGEVDGRGSRGVRGVRPYFTRVGLKIRVHSNESDARLEKLQRNVEFRCPVMNLMQAADVDVSADWQLIPRPSNG